MASMTIGGRPADTENTFGVVNPATGEVFAEAPDCTPAQLDTAFAAAAQAQRQWRLDDDERRELLRDAAGALKEAIGDLAPILVAEQGKPLKDATGELTGAYLWMKYYADLEVPRDVIQDDERAFVEVVRRPLGVVAAITPWNFPVGLAAWKFAPALRAGNTMVLKPSPYTPLTTLALGETLAGVLPAGVLNVVSGNDPLGAWMTSHHVPRKISFTGSVATGKLVAASAVPDLKRTTLELGGNDAAIVLDDADPAAIADELFWGAFANNGQVCSAIKRLYVPERLHDDIVGALAEKARSVVVGDGMTEGVQLGPLNNRPQFDRVSDLVADAVARGATVVAGGRAREGAGYFYEPTILANVSEGTRIVDEEQFGPALPVISYRDLDDVFDRANATNFGLAGSVWSADPERAATMAKRLDCGTAWANTHLAVSPRQPFGGTKWSGIGIENGLWGLYGFTDVQTVHVAR
jgi:acyl-CoA reductase-like NAD-dependent aldehyde dehydrogenase